MKFSMCSTTKKGMKIEHVIEYASKMGLDGLEIWDGHITEYLDRNKCGVEYLKNLMDLKNLKCVAIAPYFDFLDNISAERSVECALKCVEYAIKLECNIIRTFLGNKASKDLIAEEWNTCISYLKKVMMMAEKHNMFFALETHNNTPIDTKESLLGIINSVNSQYLKVLFDGFNYYIDGLDIIEAFEYIKPYIVLYHMKNYRWKEQICMPLNLGDVDFTTLISTLKKENYDGFLSFEFFCDEQDVLIRESIEWIKVI